MEKTNEQIKKTLNTNDQIIRLNVGGMSFCTTYGTLKLSPYFKERLDNGTKKIDVMENGELFIDRDGDLFNDILEYLRSYDICSDNLEELQNEAEFYKMKIMVENIKQISHEKKHSRQKQYELITFEELQKLSSLPPDNSEVTIDSFSDNYELISTLKFKALQWICGQHRTPYSTCQNNSYYQSRCCDINQIDGGKEVTMLLISKKSHPGQ
ncbi:hypothetical protein INT47_010328 [Mucor saturninus]|uniref:BTB domain-containing protein n=1 Tax=Mucor saturninus TaxID=64648 RepID=A0A8H7US49_9FUNG|nr:hypothetical protein INT47_010328 [Mucor saturninus]